MNNTDVFTHFLGKIVKPQKSYVSDVIGKIRHALFVKNLQFIRRPASGKIWDIQMFATRRTEGVRKEVLKK
jgi:hypothetical protein